MFLGYMYYDWMLYFLLYAIIGWVLEVGYAALKTGAFINRGFLNGPLCPIYGFGGTVVVALLYRYKTQYILVFMGAVLLSTIIEYLTGYLLEKIFHEHWWDYSQNAFNLHGYICLKFSLLWGIACMLVVELIHPGMEIFVKALALQVKIVILLTVSVVGLADIISTVTTIVHWKRRLQLLKEMTDILRGFSDGVGDSISTAVLKAMDVGGEWKDLLQKDERYQEILNEIEERKQLVEQLQKKVFALKKVPVLCKGRLERAFPKLMTLKAKAFGLRLEDVRKNGLWNGKKNK